MRLAATSLLVVLLAAPLFGESADLRLFVNADTPIRAGAQFYINTFVENTGPDVARNVVVTFTVDGWPDAQIPCGGRCVVGNIQPHSSGFVPQWRQFAPVSDFEFGLTIAVTSDTPDPDPSNNTTFTQRMRISTAPHLNVDLFRPYLVDPGLPFDIALLVSNLGQSTAHQLVATLDLPDGTAVRSLPAGCIVAGGRVTCLLDSLAHDSSANLPMTLVAPPRYEGGSVTFSLAVQAAEPDFDDAFNHHTSTTELYRTFLVTITADTGVGSLRNAIVEANAACMRRTPFLPPDPPCAVQFNIAESSPRPWKTIRLRSPLAPIHAASLRIDGATQAAFSGIPNPDGPSIEISGGGNVEGDGVFDDGACLSTIGNLAINGFRGNGITMFSAQDALCTASIVGNYIGTDPTGTVALPNGRGIGSAQTSGPFGMKIAGNVISGNLRSGVFLLRGTFEVTGNRIGLKAHADEPLPNGASGIYIHGSTQRVDVLQNVIAFNREMGVAIGRDALFAKVVANRIWGNGGLPIDDGLDGPSSTSTGDNGFIAVPEITNATYNPGTGNTTIVGFSSPPSADVVLYAADAPRLDGAADAQQSLGFVTPNGGVFTFRFKGDLRGQWVAASAIRNSSSQPFADVATQARTTELSAPVPVH